MRKGFRLCQTPNEQKSEAAAEEEEEMEALCNIHSEGQKLPLHLSRPSQFFSKPLLPSPKFPQPTSSFSRTSLRASFQHHLPPNPLPSLQKTPQNFFHSENHSVSLKPISPLLKSISISIATVALLLSRFPTKPSFAAAPPPSTVAPDADTLRQEEEKEKEKEMEKEKERTFEEYLDSHPDDLQALKALMGTKFNLGKIPEAIDIVDRLILIQPTNKEWPLLRAQLHLHGGDVETAKSAFEDIISADPFEFKAYYGLAMAVAQLEPSELDSLTKRIEDVMELCKKVKKKEDVRNFKLLVAQVRMVEEKYEDALKLLQQLVKEEPRDFRPYLYQGILYTLMGKKEDAEKQFRKYRRLVPRGHPYAWYHDEYVQAKKSFWHMADKEKAGLR